MNTIKLMYSWRDQSRKKFDAYSLGAERNINGVDTGDGKLLHKITDFWYDGHSVMESWGMQILISYIGLENESALRHRR